MRAKRSLGQNFLVGSHYPQRIVDSVAPQAGETILEIGPGHGALTGLLIGSGARVVAIEIDRELIISLAQRFSGCANFTLLEADVLTTDICRLVSPAASARVVANLPYYISTPILQRLIDQRQCLGEMTLMMQREVADRVTAKPGGKEYGYLSILVQFYCLAEKLFDVPPGAFRPSPKVYSSVVRLRVRSRPVVAVHDDERFFKLTKALFAQRRKTILNNLRSGFHELELPNDSSFERTLLRASIEPRRRAETLSIEEIARLLHAISIT